MTAVAEPPSRRPVGLYALIDHAVHGTEAMASACRAAEVAGATWIQLRCKEIDDRTFYDCVERCVDALSASESLLWINDRVDLAALFPVRGVHLGQGDLPPTEARELLPKEVWIGRSCHDLDQVHDAANDPAVDVLAIGPIFETRSKRDPEPCVGLDGLRSARQATDKPLVAIGGITADRYLEIRRRGADLVAMIGALGRGSALETNCRSLVALEAELDAS